MFYHCEKLEPLSRIELRSRELLYPRILPFYYTFFLRQSFFVLFNTLELFYKTIYYKI